MKRKTSPAGFVRASGVLCLGLLLSMTGCETAPESAGTLSSGERTGEPPQSPAPAEFGDASAGNAAPQVIRDIEEADIVKIVGDLLYALNRHKGLLVVNVADPDAPELIGELDLRGRGVEMIVDEQHAYVLLSADYYVFYYGIEPSPLTDALTIAPDGPIPPAPDFNGSQLAIVDITDPTAPTVEGKIELVGFANESRRVGDVIYVIGSNFGPYFQHPAGAPDEAPSGEGFVASVNVSNPADIVPVERKNLAGDALTMHTSTTTIFAAGRDYNADFSETLTEIQVVDISDAAGKIELRDRFTVPGSIRNRFYMDEYEGAFRIATESFGFGFQTVRLFTYDLADLDNVTPLGETAIIQDESLEAVRFDGPRGYVVTFLIVDPLFVLDLSDPANPQVTGELEVPGFSTHIEPRGNRLIAVGIDDTDGRRPAVAYYDVEDPTKPAQLGRVILGPPGSFTSSEATYDEKAFKIIDELNLIAIPFRHVDYGDVIFFDSPAANDVAAAEYTPPVCTNGVQLVDFDDNALVQRGAFEHRGNVTRVGTIGERVFALSQLGLQTVDITDRDKPTAAGKTEFFDEEQMNEFDDCGGFIRPVLPIPIPEPGPDFVSLLRMIDACGTVNTLPVLMLPLMLVAGRRYYRRR